MASEIILSESDIERVVTILKLNTDFPLLHNKWTELAQKLKTPFVDNLDQEDIDLESLANVIHRLLSKWILQNGQNATLHILGAAFERIGLTSISDSILDTFERTEGQNFIGSKTCLKMEHDFVMDISSLVTSNISDASETQTPLPLSLMEDSFVFDHEDDHNPLQMVWKWKDKYGNSFLHILVKNKSLKEVNVLLQNGADSSVRNDKKEGLLHAAAYLADKEASFDFIKCLVGNDVDVWAKDRENRTFLHVIAQNKGGTLTPTQFHKIVHYLVGRGHAGLFCVQGWSNGATPLQWAVANIEVEERTLLLLKKERVDFSLKNEYKTNLLTYAVFGNRSSELISLLINLGADQNLLNRVNASLLHIAAELGNYEASTVFIDEGLEVNGLDSSGNTPLHNVLAFSNKNVVEIARALVGNGADVNATNKRGISPLAYALERKFDFEINSELIRLLTGYQEEAKEKENVQQKTEVDNQQVNMEIGLKMIKHLINSQANLLLKDVNNLTFLHKLLIDGESLPSPAQFHDISFFILSQNNTSLFGMKGGINDYTPLQLAVKNVDVKEKTMRLLESKGVDFSVKDETGKSLVEIAIYARRSYECLEILSKIVMESVDRASKDVKRKKK